MNWWRKFNKIIIIIIKKCYLCWQHWNFDDDDDDDSRIHYHRSSYRLSKLICCFWCCCHHPIIKYHTHSSMWITRRLFFLKIENNFRFLITFISNVLYSLVMSGWGCFWSKKKSIYIVELSHFGWIESDRENYQIAIKKKNKNVLVKIITSLYYGC